MTVFEKIKRKILHSKDGSIFFAGNFPQFDEEYVGQVLSELCRQNLIARLANGMYLKPMRSKFGIIYPPADEIIAAISKRDKARILPTGNTALNQLGLSTQVPMHSEYITSGSARIIKVGNRTIKLRRSVPKNFAYKGTLMPVLVQALKALKEENITEEHLGIIRGLLKDYPENNTWKQDIQLAPVWIKKMILNIKQSLDNE